MKAIKTISILLLALFLFVSCATGEQEYNVHTELQKEALSSSWERMTLYAKGSEENSYPEPVIIKGLKSSSIHLSSSLEERDVPVMGGEVKLYNLYLGEEYNWSDGRGNKGSFKTLLAPPRNIKVDGVTNFRDLGGWKSNIRQGLLYRSGRFSENQSGEILITDEGKRVLTDELGIKTEIDLREVRDGENGNLQSSPIGDEVRYISLPFKKGGGYLQQNLSSFPILFEILSNRNMYPLVFHCSIGTDRTGAVAFVLEALLGVEEDDLYRDYLFSNFGKIEGIRRPSAIKDYLNLLSRYAGDTLSDKAKTMLIENGVSEEDIEAFISIMTE